MGNFDKEFFSVLTKSGCFHGIVANLPIFRNLKNSPVQESNQQVRSRAKEMKLNHSRGGLGCKSWGLTLTFRPSITKVPFHGREGVGSPSWEDLERNQLV